MRDYIVVIPVHNGEKTILDALASVVQQSVVPRKIVVFDNASTDGTVERVIDFSRDIKIPVDIVHSEEVLTPNKSFETSISTVNGRFMWLAADDMLFPWAAEKLLKARCQEDCSHTVAGVPIFFKRTGTLQLGKRFLENLSPLDFLSDPSDASLIYGMHSSEKVKGLFPDKYFPAWDWSFLYRCVDNGVHIYGSHPISLRESTEIDEHRQKIKEETGILRIFPYLGLTKDVLQRQNFFRNLLSLPTLMQLNIKGYLNFGVHHDKYLSFRILKKRFDLNSLVKIRIGRLRHSRTLLKIYASLPVTIRKLARRFLGLSIPNNEDIFSSRSFILNENKALSRSNFLSLNTRISHLEFNPNSTFDTAQIIEIIRFFYANSVEDSQLKLNLSHVNINREFVSMIVKGFERSFSRREIVYSNKSTNKVEGVVGFYSLLWKNEFMQDLIQSIRNSSNSYPAEKSAVNLFLPSIPLPNRDAGSVDAIYLLVILKMLGVETSIYLNNFMTPNPVALDLLRRFGEVRLVSDFSNNKGHNLIYGPYAYAEFEPYSWEVKFTYLMVDAVFRRYDQSKGMISPSDLKALIYERNALRDCETALCISEADQIAVKEKFPLTQTEIYPIIRFPRTRYANNESEREWLTFIGSIGHTPNREAVEWIVKEFGPRLFKAQPNIKIALAGLGTEKYDSFKSNIVGLGVVSDLPKLYQRTFATIAPMDIAAGVNGKVVESLGFGVTPIVSSVVAGNLPQELAIQCNVAENLDQYVERAIHLSKNYSKFKVADAAFECVNGNRNFHVLKELLGPK